MQCLFQGGSYLRAAHFDCAIQFISCLFFMAYRLKANLSFGFHYSLVFNNVSLNVNVLNVAKSSQDLTQDAQCILSSYSRAALINFSTPCGA